jgi:H2-forming N5,N10-methylenetetrahydromethanopterin dehydrogenase-like enzyme
LYLLLYIRQLTKKKIWGFYGLSEVSSDKLLSLTREDGEVVEEHEVVKSDVIAYFQRVLGVDQMLRVLNEEAVKSAINLKLSSTQHHVLAQDVTREEIKHAMFSLKNNKAPGPDGFNAGFFKRMWHIVGEDVINAVSSFFQTRRMLKK